MNYLSLLPAIIPILRKIVGNSGHKQLVDMLDSNMPAIQSILGFVTENVQLKSSSNNDQIIALLLNKIPDAQNIIGNLNPNTGNNNNNFDIDRVAKLEIEVQNMKELLLDIAKKVK